MMGGNGTMNYIGSYFQKKKKNYYCERPVRGQENMTNGCAYDKNKILDWVLMPILKRPT